MKKTLFLLFITLFVFSCRRYVDCLDNYHYNKTDPTGITLNGVNEDTAKAMMANYNRLRIQDTRPTRESVWFDANSFHNVVALLEKENKNDPTVDGMRVYFASKPNLVNNHMVNSVVFVATTDAGPFPGDNTQRLHKDYYQHNKNDILFQNTDAIKGQEEKKPAAIVNIFRGEYLYDVYFGRDTEVLKSNPHYISRQKAHAMANQFGKDTMRTIGEWFDLKMLESLDKTTHDGIRIYFARHDSTYSYPHHPIKSDPDALKEAFVFIPTTAIGKSGKWHKDNFDKANFEGLNNYVKRVYEQMKRSGGIRPMLVDSLGGDDDGNLCPNNCTPQ